MNEQQQRMAAVGTDKELSDLLDFSAVREWESSLGGSGWHWEEELKRVRYRSGFGQRRAGGLNERRSGDGRVKGKSVGKNLQQKFVFSFFFLFFLNNRSCQLKIFPSFILGMQR